MEEKRIEEIRRKVAVLLDEKRLKEAITTLSADIDEVQEWSLRTRFTQMQSAYDYLLEYLRGGTPDPGREDMHNTLIGECYMLNDQIAITRKAEKHPTTSELPTLHNRLRENYANIKVTELLPQSECEKVKKELSEEHELLLDKTFSIISHSIAWSKGDTEIIVAMISDEELPVNDRAIIISAVTLAFINCLEPAKAITLIKAATDNNPTLSTRAIVGCIIGISLYEKRIEYYPEILAALQTLHDYPRILSRIATIQIQLLRCRETQKIDRKMREEIIPAMMKNPHINSEKMGMDILREIEQEEDKNPEWKEWVEKDEIKEKLEEMTKWQIEGADVYMSTFSQLKNYPFFRKTMNWLRPFDTTIPEISGIMPHDRGTKRTMLAAICASRFFCNSDKYSFCLTIKQVPQEQRDMLMQQIPDEGEIAEQGPDAMIQNTTEKTAEAESNQYIQDLYRFFKLAPERRKFNDPFVLPLNLLESPTLCTLVTDADTTLRIFNYLIDKGYYAEAASVGHLYEKCGELTEQFYQEMGYCKQKEKEYNAAIDYYTRADIIKPDTLWTLSHIAQCYRLAGKAEKAISYYLLAEDIAPENISLLRQTGECFATLKKYEEAFARFFKVEFLKPGSINTMRAIAWCSFLTEKDEQARGYYKKILELKKAKYNDYLNAAHVEWITHNNATAVELYKKAKELCADDETFFAQLSKDAVTLTERGASEGEITLLRDLLV